MAILPIVIAPDPVLKAKAKPVAVVDDDIRRLMDDMLETMYAAPGVGLAANQVGVLLRVIVVDAARENDPPAPYRMANPEVTWASQDLNVWNEGCLSLPDHYADVTRPAEIRLTYLDYDGHQQETHATGLLATCVQHEIDHLNGTIFVDHITALKRNIILRKLVKFKKSRDEDTA